MRTIRDFTDARYRGFCLHCGASLSETTSTRDHVPSKVLLDRPLPVNVHVVEICGECNNGFSANEEYFAAFLGATMSGSVEPVPEMFESARRALFGNSKLAAEISRSAETYVDEDGVQRLIWRPELERIEKVVVKNARGHAHYELGQPCFGQPEHVLLQPLITAPEKWITEFLLVDHGNAWPEVGSRLLQRLYSGEDMAAGWIIVQPGVYVFTVFENDGIVVRSIIREYLLTEVRWS